MEAREGATLIATGSRLRAMARVTIRVAFAFAVFQSKFSSEGCDMVARYGERGKSYAIYVRTWDDDGPERAPEAQIKACVMKAILLANERHEEDMDVDLTQEHHPGTELIRPGLDEIRKSVAEGKVSAVIAYDPEVFAESLGSQVFVIDDIENHGVGVYFAREGFDASPEGKFFRLIRKLLARHREETKKAKSMRGDKLHPEEYPQ